MPRPILPDAEQRAHARRVYGADPVGYEEGRPDYPTRVASILADRGLRPGAEVLEIGPGTGRVTRSLVDAGASVTAVEPDPVLAGLLARDLGSAGVRILQSTFEQAKIAEDGYDLVVAAMSFHWVEQAIGLPKLGRILRPGGWAAIWWTMFRDPSRADPFGEAAAEVLGPPPGGGAGISFELDTEGWLDSLSRGAGLTEVAAEVIPWTARFDAASLRALYGSMIGVRRRPEAEQQAVLDELERIATTRFSGVVDRPFVTSVYTGRRG